MCGCGCLCVCEQLNPQVSQQRKKMMTWKKEKQMLQNNAAGPTHNTCPRVGSARICPDPKEANYWVIGLVIRTWR